MLFVAATASFLTPFMASSINVALPSIGRGPETEPASGSVDDITRLATGMLLDQEVHLGFQLWLSALATAVWDRARLQTGTADVKHDADPPHRAAGKRLLHCSDVSGIGGWRLIASRMMSMSMTMSPIFCFNFLICSSFRASSSFGRAHAPDVL